MSFTPEFCRRLVTEWNHCHGAFFRLRGEDLAWHRDKQSWLSYSAAEAAGVPVLLARAAPLGLKEGVSAKTLWVSLYGKIPSGREADFFRALDGFVKAEEKTRLALGGEEFHLTPGIPDDPLSDFSGGAEVAGFKLTRAADFVGSLRDPAVSAYVREAEAIASRDGWSLTRVDTSADMAALGDFLRREFRGRWEREFRFWRDREDTKRAFWNVLRNVRGELVGFARLGVRGNEACDWLPGALRFPLALHQREKNTDSCLGPIGVAASGRGQGVGKVLLGLALQLLSQKEAELVCIDWTNAYNYYKPLGFPAVREYSTAVKDY